MAGTSKRDRLLRSARDLYACGLSYAAIARRLKVCKRTIENWSVRDRQLGMCWADERERLRDPAPDQLLRLLRGRCAEIIIGEGAEVSQDAEGRRQHEKRLHAMVKLIKDYQKSWGEIMGALLALEEFAGFCVENLPDDDLAVARRVMDLYLEHLRRKNT
jgi:hypothetical protein